MTFKSLLQSVISKPGRQVKKKRPFPRFWPELERLEPRQLLAVSVFEIETNANALDQSSPVTDPPDDWNSALQIVTPNPITNNTAPAGSSHAAVASFIADPAATDITYFDPGAEDDLDVSQWLHQGPGAPDKDDLTNAYAAAYHDNSQLIIAFGADRFDTSGTAQMGYWFFQDEVGLGANGTFTGLHDAGSVNSSGTVTDPGDFLILTDFTQGGAVPNVRIYLWVGAKLGDAQRQRTDSAWSPTGPLQLLFDTQQAATADINGDGSIDIAAGVNTVDATASWAYLDKDGNTSFTPHSFFEGAINATDLGLSGGCISSFLAESRTSGSAADARLKDFAIGEFELCNIEVTQTGNTLGPVTDPVDYIITVTNTGAMPLFPRSINDVGDGWSGLGDLLNPANRTGIDDSVGGPGLEDNVLAIGETWTITASYTVKAGDPDPLKNTVTAIFSHDASDLLADTVSDSASHSVNLFQPAVDVQKSIIGNPTTVSVGDTIAFRFTITNTSDGDLNTPALDDLNGNTSDLIFDSISDPFLGDLTAKVISAGLNVLDFGETGFFDVPYTVQASDAPSLTNTVTVHYHPEAFPNDVTDTASVTLPVEQLRGRIVPAGTTPQQYIDFAINGTGGDPGDDDDFADGGFNYTTSGGKITNVSDPGTAFYYTVFTAPSSSFSVQVVQTATLGGGEMDLTSLQVLKAVGSAPTATGVVLVGNFSPLQVGTDSTVNLNSANLGEDPTGDLLVLRWRVQAKSIEGKPDPSQTYRLDFKTLVNNVQVDQDPDGILVIRSNPLHLAAPAVAYPTGEQLTHDGLQAAVDQAIASWRAAGVSPEALNGLRLLNFSIDNMLNNLLAWQSGNRIVIDADAGGCGYSTGRVDLLSVI